MWAPAEVSTAKFLLTRRGFVADRHSYFDRFLRIGVFVDYSNSGVNAARLAQGKKLFPYLVPLDSIQNVTKLLPTNNNVVQIAKHASKIGDSK